MDDSTTPTTGPDEATLLAAVARLWRQVDPAPADLADGVLARIAAEDLEFELLALVEGQDAFAGVRSAVDASEPADEGTSGDEMPGEWSLEYAGPDLHVHLRLTRREDRVRVDGWVVPASPLVVRMKAPGQQDLPETQVDEFGRFELTDVPTGLARLTFTDPRASGDRPRITPPFWI